MSSQVHDPTTNRASRSNLASSAKLERGRGLCSCRCWCTRSVDIPCIRILIVAIFLILSFSAAYSQDYPSRAVVRSRCKAPPLSSGPEFDQVAAISQRLDQSSRHIYFVVANNPVVNAWEVELSQNESLVCIPVALIRFLDNNEGQLAFVLGHEIGHAVDESCKSLSERARIASRTKSGAVLTFLFGRTRGDEAVDQRVCESRADELGFSLMTRAGYDPRDAAAAFEKLSLYLGDTATGPIARLSAIGRTHPITPDRIRHMRKLVARPTQ